MLQNVVVALLVGLQWSIVESQKSATTKARVDYGLAT